MRQFLKLSFIFIITLILYGCNQNIKEINVKYFVEGDLHFEVIITDEFILADEPVKEGYIFNGWYFDEDFNEELKLDEISLLDEINLYANFIPSNNTKYVVNYYLENIEDDEYSLLETESMEGTTNVVVRAVVREYDGFNFDLEKSNVEGVIKADESLVLNLYYQRDLFSVTFDSRGGDSVNKIDNIKFGSKIDLINTEKAGFNFLGWFLDDRMFDFDEKITQNLTLVAKWEEQEDKTYLVTFDSDGGSHVEEITVVKGAKIDKPTDPVREGYTFTGWKLNDAHYNFNSSVNENITLKASWRADVYYQVDFNTFGGSLIESVLVKENEKLEKPLDPTKEGYIFMYWHLDYLVFDFNTPITSNLTLEALWDYEIPHYTMSYMTDGGNKIEPFYLEEGSLIPKPDTPIKEGYKFVKWIYARPEMFAGFEVNFSEDTIIGNTIIKAVWVEDEKPKMQMLSFGLNGGKWDDEHVVGAKISYPYSGDIIEVPDDPYRVGYEFLGWYIDDEPFNYEVMPNHALYILAKWEVNSYEINYTILNEANHLEYKTLLYEDEHFIKISRGQNVTMALTNKNRLLAAGYRTSFHLNGAIGTAIFSKI